MNRTDTRLYKVQNDGEHYWAGHVENGHQVLMGIQLPELVLVQFDAEGNHIGLAVRDLSGSEGNGSGEASEIDEDQAQHELLQWQAELGFVPSTIAVRQFFLPDRWIGIRDLPEHYQEAIDQPITFAEERLREIQRDIARWKEEGYFVLDWDEEYYLNRNGELESS